MNNHESSISSSGESDSQGISDDTWRRLMGAVRRYIETEGVRSDKKGQTHRLGKMHEHLRKMGTLRWSDLPRDKDDEWEKITEGTFEQYQVTLRKAIKSVLEGTCRDLDLQLPPRKCFEIDRLGLLRAGRLSNHETFGTDHEDGIQPGNPEPSTDYRKESTQKAATETAPLSVGLKRSDAPEMLPRKNS